MKRPLSLVLCLLVPVVIFLVGGIFAAIFLFKEVPALARENGRGLVPPGFTAEITEAGSYTVWLHTNTVYEGNAYEHGDRPPTGSKIILNDQRNNHPITINPILTNATKSMGSDTAVAVGTFASGGNTTVEVLGTGFAQPAVLSIAPQKIGDVLRSSRRPKERFDAPSCSSY